MQSIRRSCHSALQSSKPSCRVANGSRRAFSQSSACQRGALPQFLESSSPELATILARFNSRILLPEHLTKEQRDLVFKQENRPRLEAEPVEITLGEVTLPLEHINRNRDQPGRWETVRQVVAQSETAEDWENVVRLMEGFHDASVHLKPSWFQKIAWGMHEADMHHLLLKSLQRANKTGMRLRSDGIVRTVFTALHTRAAASGWDEAETEKMLRLAEQITELMERDEHLGGSNARRPDLRASPFVISVPLELAAVRSRKFQQGQDTDGKVLKLATRLVSALGQNEFLAEQLPKYIRVIEHYKAPKENHVRNAALADLKRKIIQLIPLWNALKTSSHVLGANMPEAQKAQQTEKSVRSALDKGLKILESEVKGGFKIKYDHVTEAMQQCENV